MMTLHDDMSDRLSSPPDDRTPIRAIEVSFSIPVWLNSDQEKRLHGLIDEITDSPWNTPVDGVHWLSGYGSRPHWSKADAAFLGREADPAAPESGEPTFDESVLHMETTAREFVSEQERDRVMKRRAKGIS
jgi:hypothetical protein